MFCSFKMLLPTFLLLAIATDTFCQPNIVFILTDDQDLMLDGLTPMEKTKQLITEKGVAFTNAFTTTPVCCPSRSSILTGLYLHNHGTVNNTVTGGCSGSDWQSQSEPKTYGAFLHAHGYRTFFAGKYLNQYGFKRTGGVEHVPEGWDWWVGLVGNSKYYNYTLSVNGTSVGKNDSEDDYLTDVLKHYSLEFLKQVQEPFLMAINTPAPHEPFTPANRHKGRFLGRKAPRTPNFNVPVAEKHWVLRLPPEVLPNDTVDVVDEAFANRWESLLAVDELIESVINRLIESHVLDNTYVILASDHGFHLGQFAQAWDKRQPYETDIRIPLLVRGPGVPENKTISSPILNIDFAPTFLDMAGLPNNEMDGESFLSKLNEIPDGKFNRTFLIEYHGEYTAGDPTENECYEDENVYLCSKKASCKCFDSKNNTYLCIRTLTNDVNEIYCAFADDENFVELYDLNADPYQLKNLASSKTSSRYRKLIEKTKTWKIANNNMYAVELV